MSRIRRQWGEGSSLCLKLAAGGSVSVTFKGNLFDLTAEERRLVADLSAVIELYKAAEKSQQAAAVMKA